MSSSNLLYRLSQKWKYHFSEDLFQKKVAEINRNGPLILLSPSTFGIKGSDLVFSRQYHSFLVDRFDLFQTLLHGRGKFRVEKNDLLYAIDGLTLRITTSEEIFIIHEIFFEHCYRVLAPWSYEVIDIGMNVGFASLFFAQNNNVLKVYGYEPFGPTYHDAKVNFALNPEVSSKIVSNNFGLGAKSEKLTLNYFPDLKGKNSTHDEGLGNENIELKPASQIFEQLTQANPEGRFFVKMDCEGAEFDIFESLKGAMIYTQIFGFIIEWHVKNPQPIVDVLLSNDFKVQLQGNSEIGLITAFR